MAWSLLFYAAECFTVRPENSEDHRKIGSRGAMCLLHVSTWGLTLALQVLHFISIRWFTPGFLQYSDIVVWAPGMASGLWKAGCWFVGGDNLTGALAPIKSWMETLPTLLHVGC